MSGRIIGITGRAGAGKDALADVLVRERGFVRVSLADPIKRACAEWFGWSVASMYDPVLKEQPDPAWGGLTRRRVMQHIGTEGARALHPDVWVRAALRYVELEHRIDVELTGVVIPDVRFDNEAAAIRAAGGRIVRVVRPGAGLSGDAAAHASEAGVADDLVDFTIVNDAGLDWLAACARGLA